MLRISSSVRPALREGEADEYLRRLQIGVAVIELRDAAPAQQFAEPQE
jgi:hypothetical protein